MWLCDLMWAWYARDTIPWLSGTRLLPLNRHEWTYQPGFSVPFLCLCCGQLLSDWQSLAWVFFFKLILPSLLWPWLYSFEFYSHRQSYFCLWGFGHRYYSAFPRPRARSGQILDPGSQGPRDMCLFTLQLLHPGSLKPTFKGAGFWDTLGHISCPCPFLSLAVMLSLISTWNSTS